MIPPEIVKAYAEEHGLSKRQIEVLDVLSRNPQATSNEIAAEIGCAAATVNVHLFKIMDKTGAKSKRVLLQQLDLRARLAEGQLKGVAPFRVVFADDDPVFRDLVVQAMEVIVGPRALVFIYESGLEAMMHLSRSKKNDPDFPTPDIILLDLVMPQMDGMKTLEKIKGDSALRGIPVIIFSSQTEAESIRDTYTQGANSFVVKPAQAKDVEKTLRLILQYWVELGSLPKIG